MMGGLISGLSCRIVARELCYESPSRVSIDWTASWGGQLFPHPGLLQSTWNERYIFVAADSELEFMASITSGLRQTDS